MNTSFWGIVRRFWDKHRSTICLCLITALLSYLLLNVFFTIVFVKTGSMEPTIKAHSVVVCWRFPYVFSMEQVRRSDIIVFRKNNRSEYVIKRVIGLPGEQVSMINGTVLINGSPLIEEYLINRDSFSSDAIYHIPADSVFVLGDNRPESIDSRHWNDSYIPIDCFIAKPIFSFGFF